MGNRAKKRGELNNVGTIRPPLDRRLQLPQDTGYATDENTHLEMHVISSAQIKNSTLRNHAFSYAETFKTSVVLSWSKTGQTDNHDDPKKL